MSNSDDHLGLLLKTKEGIKRGKKFLDDLGKATKRSRRLTPAQAALLESTNRLLEKLYKEEDQLHELWLTKPKKRKADK